MREIRGPTTAAHREHGRCLRALQGGEGCRWTSPRAPA